MGIQGFFGHKKLHPPEDHRRSLAYCRVLGGGSLL